jgi:acetyl coenzyme A synthetase (ADP forming)-like protein
MKDLNAIFSPKSIAIIGASSKPLSVGWEMMRCVLNFNFTGTVFPVNPKAKAISGIKAYPSVLEIPDEVDLAVIVVKRDFVLPTMEQCAEKGVKAAIVITAGFREVSHEGAELEDKILQIARENNIVMLGPNCMGAFNTNDEILLNATFARKLPKRGPIGLISQSGAMGAAVLDYANERHIGFSKFISIGNKADIDENDCLEAFEKDDEVGVVVLYLENFADPQRFAEICKRVTPKKPVLVLKSGRSEAGAKAASSHTGALAGSDTAVDALLERCGAMRVDSIEDLLVISHFFSSPRRPEGNRLGLITNAGGPGIIATDELQKKGFSFPELAPETVKELESKLPAEASCANPTDVLPGTGAQGYQDAAYAQVKDPNLDAVVILFLCPSMVQPKWLVDAIIPVVKSTDKPVIGLFMGASDVVQLAEPLAELGMPILTSAPEVARALVANRQYREILNRTVPEPANYAVDEKRAKEIVDGHGEGWLESEAAFNLLDSYGIPVVRTRTVDIEDDPVEKAGELKYPLVMKILSPDILHKSDVGGVEINIKDEADLKHRYEEMLKRVKFFQPEARLVGVELQEMITWDMELIIGINREPGFGPMVMCGLGGVFVEVMKDVVFSLAPMPADEPAKMLHKLRSAPILEGVRGTAGIDTKLVGEVIGRIAKLAADFPRLEQLDINPLLAGPDGCCAVDCRIRLTE